MTQIIPSYVTPDYLKDLRSKLRHGTGSGAVGDRCSIQEVRAWLSLDPSSDACPDCVCPVLHKLVIVAQDSRKEWRADIAELLPALVGSRGSADLTNRRAYRCADWANPTVSPFALEAASRALAAAGIAEHPQKLQEHAEKLRALSPVAAAAAACAAANAAANACRRRRRRRRRTQSSVSRRVDSRTSGHGVMTREEAEKHLT